MCANNSVCQAPKAPGELFFSLSELKRLVEQENSSVSVVTIKRSITLMPFHLKNLQASVKDLLKANVNRYDVQLEGIILAHKFVKLMVDNVKLSDRKNFSLEYMADIYVFKPKVGDRLTGTVNQLRDAYINILVHGIFNVSVYPSGRREVEDLKIGCEVVVKVLALNYTGMIPFIKASIVSSGNAGEADKANAKKIKRKSQRHEEEQNSLIGVSQRAEQSSLIGVSQRKEIVSILKNSPLRIRQSSSELETQEAESSSTESSKAKGSTPIREATGETPKKKKKKKGKSDEADLVKDLIPAGEKSARKRKREEDHGDDIPKKKKKKDQETTADKSSEKSPLNNTAQILADESIVKAASSTPVLAPPPKKKKKRRSDKAEQSALVDSLLHLKMEEMAAPRADITNTSDASKSKKAEIKQEPAVQYQSHDVSSSVDTDSQTGSKKKKKKKKKGKDSSEDDLAKLMLSNTLKSMKDEA